MKTKIILSSAIMALLLSSCSHSPTGQREIASDEKGTEVGNRGGRDDRKDDRTIDIDLTKYQIDVNYVELVRNRKTGLVEKTVTALNDDEIKDMLKGVQIKELWLVRKYNIAGVVGSLFTMGHGGSGSYWEDKQKDISPTVINVSHGRINFVPTRDNSLKYSTNYTENRRKIVMEFSKSQANGMVCENLEFEGKDIETYNCYRKEEGAMIKSFSDSAYDTEFYQDVYYIPGKKLNLEGDGMLPTPTCEIGFNLSAENIKMAMEELRIACKQGNYKSCASVPEFKRVLAQNLKISTLKRETGEITQQVAKTVLLSFKVDTSIEARGDRMFIQFLDDKGNEIMTGDARYLESKDCGVARFIY